MIPSELARGLEGRYRIERELGAGGMATVFLARDLKHDRDVAIKVLREDISATLGAERFAKEIAVTARLQHANILPLFESGAVAGQLFYVMPFVDGEPLRRRLAGRPLSIDESMLILRDVARALAYAHSRGVVHRDIKPENILLAGGAAMVADFGVAKALTESRTAAGPTGATLTSIGTSIGTPAYMAPEQAAGDPATGAGADVYAWGVVAYELLAGRHPFAEQVTPQGLMAAHIATAARPLGEVRQGLPTALAALVMECLAKTPAERPRDGDALAARLAAISSSGETTSLPPKQSGMGRLLGVAAVLAIVAVGAWAMTRGGASEASVAKERSIAVLPFDVGADTANLYVADGLTAELTTKLSRIPGIAVRAYSSSMAMRGQSPVKAAELLGVNTILTASMVRAQSRLHVNASMVDGSDARVLWSDSFDGEDKDQFALQERLAGAIAGALRITLSPETRSAFSAGGTNDPMAHDLVQRARFLMDRLGDSLAVAEAIRMAEEATRRDSTYVDAWIAVAAAWLNLADDNVPPAVLIGPAQTALDRALRLAPTEANALAWAGSMLTWYARDTAGSQMLLRRALAADSTQILANATYGVNLYASDPDLAARSLARAIRLGALAMPVPDVFSIWIPHVFRAMSPDSGSLTCSRFKSLIPALGTQCEAMRLWTLGRTAEAQKVVRGIDQTVLRPNEWAYLSMTAATVGDTATARTALDAVERLASSRYVREDAVAVAYFRLGDRESAIRWFERGAKSRSGGVGIVGSWREFDPLRSDPRFRAAIAPSPIPR